MYNMIIDKKQELLLFDIGRGHVTLLMRLLPYSNVNKILINNNT